jgi:site-specific DNA-methyltransferase (adenine-specific)
MAQEGVEDNREVADPEAQQWEGWGTALKPAWEPIIVARKPLSGTVATNVLEQGTGGLNIDASRVGDNPGWSYPNGPGGSEPHHMQRGETKGDGNEPRHSTLGRWPANLIHDGSDEVMDVFPSAPGQQADALVDGEPRVRGNVYAQMNKYPRGREGEASADSDNNGEVGFHMQPGARRLDSGSAARFFYCAKASKADRNWGLGTASNGHPTVKPLSLMQYLVRMVTPPEGTVLDPFCGSGSTGVAAILEGFRFVGIELSDEYADIADARIASAVKERARIDALGTQESLFA